MAGKRTIVNHVSQEAMVKILEKTSKRWRELVPEHVNVSVIPAVWKDSIGTAVGAVFPESDDGPRDILARKFLELVWKEAQHEKYQKDGPLEKMNENMLARKLTSFTSKLYKGAEQDNFGSDAAFALWKKITEKRKESFEAVSQKAGSRKNYEPRYTLAFDMDVLNKIIKQAQLIRFKKHQSNIRLVKFVSLLVIAAAILTYSNKKKVYRFARTQFRKIMDTWRRFRGRPAIHDTLNKLESSGRMSSPGTNKEMSIDEALRAIEMGNGFRTRSPPNSRTTYNKGSRAGSSSPVTKKSPKQKFKWIEFHVGAPKQKPKTKTTRR